MTEKILELNKEKTLFWALLTILVLCAGFYMYFINATIRNVVARQNAENKISELSLAIGDKEFQYISLRNTITLPLAYSLGFTDVSSKTFLSKKSVVKSVAYVTYTGR